MKALAMPFQVGWDIVHRCNYRCKHCYFSAEQLADKTMATKNEAIDFVRYLASKKVFHLSLAGGEPLLYPHIVDVVREATAGGISVAMSTNASRLTDAMANSLRKAGLKSIQVSLDGCTEATNDAIRGAGCFAQSVRGLDTGIRHGFQIVLAIVLLQKNKHEIHDYFEYAAKKQIRGIKVQTFIDSGLGHDNLGSLEIPEAELRELIIKLWQHKRRFAKNLEIMLPLVPEVLEQAKTEPEYFNRDTTCLGCQPGLSTIRVNSYGDVRACGSFVNAAPIGNVFATPLQRIWRESRELVRWRNESLVDTGKSTNTCGAICGKGCRAASAPAFSRH